MTKRYCNCGEELQKYKTYCATCVKLTKMQRTVRVMDRIYREDSKSDILIVDSPNSRMGFDPKSVYKLEDTCKDIIDQENDIKRLKRDTNGLFWVSFAIFIIGGLLLISPMVAHGSCQNKSELETMQTELDQITDKRDARKAEINARGSGMTQVEESYYNEKIRGLKKDIRLFKGDKDVTCVAEEETIEFGEQEYTQDELIELIVMLLMAYLSELQ